MLPVVSVNRPAYQPSDGATSPPTSAADAARLAGLYTFLSTTAACHPDLPPEWVPSWRYVLTIPGAPATKVRHRSRKGGQTYKEPEDVASEQRTATFLHQLRTAHGGPLTGNVALGAVFYRPDMQWIDADNMVKHVCDAGNGVLWLDDSQITAQCGVVEYDPTNPRTVLVVGPHYSAMRRGTDTTTRARTARTPSTRRSARFATCEGCGKPIAKTLTWCNTCRRGVLSREANPELFRVAALDGLFE